MPCPNLEHSYACMVERVSNYAIFLLDPAGVIQTWNPAAALMKGYAADEAIGEHFRLLYTDEEKASGHPEHNLLMAAKNGTFTEEAWRKRKDGTIFWPSNRVRYSGTRDGRG